MEHYITRYKTICINKEYIEKKKKKTVCVTKSFNTLKRQLSTFGCIEDFIKNNTFCNICTILNEATTIRPDT